MLRVALALLVALAATASVPVASACCHVYHVEQDVGPCTAEWHGNGLRLYQDRAGASCTAGGHTAGATVEDDLPPCDVRPARPCE